MSAHVERGRLLLAQGRHQLAEQELRLALSESPEDPAAAAFLSVAISEQGRHDEAIEVAQGAVRADPGLDFTHYALARALADAERLDDAARSIREAIRLDPADATYAGLHAAILGQKRRWELALQEAERGLSLDPEESASLHIRTLALRELGRHEEAAVSAERALAVDPDDAFAHANRGFEHLRRGEAALAEERFREALRLDPQLEVARSGVVEAIKSHHPVYRVILRAMIAFGSLPRGVQVGIVIGIVVSRSLLARVEAAAPALAPLVVPLQWTLGAVVLLSWIAGPLSDLLLRLHPFGRLALSRHETMAANFTGLSLLVAVAALVAAAWTGDGAWARVAGGAALFVVPVSAVFRSRVGSRRVFALAAAGLAAVGVSGIACLALGAADAASSLGTIYLLGVVVLSWVIFSRQMGSS